jgi:hypothetical protein
MAGTVMQGSTSVSASVESPGSTKLKLALGTAAECATLTFAMNASK